LISAYFRALGPRNRAPLGLKTTNAKAKAFQTPLAQEGDNGIEKTQVDDKAQQQSTASRRVKPIPSYNDSSKLGVHGVGGNKDEEREIEYMPPKPKGTMCVLFSSGVYLKFP
jgi:hypothetical protein